MSHWYLSLEICKYFYLRLYLKLYILMRTTMIGEVGWTIVQKTENSRSYVYSFTLVSLVVGLSRSLSQLLYQSLYLYQLSLVLNYG